jgi:hypothetical protein
MVPANLQKVLEMVPKIDAVFYAGDCVTNPDSLDDWFGTSSGRSFFPVFQGKGCGRLGDVQYRGASLLQSAPIFCATGNHEIMGRLSKKPISEQAQDAFPIAEAEKQYRQSHDAPPPEEWIRDHTFNTVSFSEIFSLGKRYYATTFGDIRLVVLAATRIGRDAALGIKGKYTESPKDFEDPLSWGYGEFIIESLKKGSPQYLWLEKELQSKEFQSAKYKIVMLHNPIHTLGENQIPAFADPIQHIDRDTTGKITRIWYEYPKNQDFLLNDIDPLFAQFGVQLVYSAHSHIWCRFTSPTGVHYLESSNVGNSYGTVFQGAPVFSPQCTVKGASFEEPNGLSPMTPTVSPLKSSDGVSLPFIASNEITVFSVFDTKNGCVDSYYFDTKQKGNIVLFDKFYLNDQQK